MNIVFLVRPWCWACLLLISAAHAGPLEDYLAKPASAVKWDWGSEPPQTSVPKYQRMFRLAKTDTEKAIAVGNLSVIANQMAMEPASRAAGKQLNAEWVMPNLELTRVLDDSHSIAWRHSILRARNIYRLCGDHDAEKQCLANIYKADAKEGDKDLAVYLLAYQQAGMGDHQGAIKTLNHIKPESRYAESRDKLIQIWTKEMNRKTKGASK